MASDLQDFLILRFFVKKIGFHEGDAAHGVCQERICVRHHPRVYNLLSSIAPPALSYRRGFH